MVACTHFGFQTPTHPAPHTTRRTRTSPNAQQGAHVAGTTPVQGEHQPPATGAPPRVPLSGLFHHGHQLIPSDQGAQAFQLSSGQHLEQVRPPPGRQRPPRWPSSHGPASLMPAVPPPARPLDQKKSFAWSRYFYCGGANGRGKVPIMLGRPVYLTGPDKIADHRVLCASSAISSWV